MNDYDSFVFTGAALSRRYHYLVLGSSYTNESFLYVVGYSPNEAAGRRVMPQNPVYLFRHITLQRIGSIDGYSR